MINPSNALGSPATITVDLPSVIVGNQIRVTRDGISTIGGGNFLALGEVLIGSLSDVILPLGTDLT
ncbi:MAG: hypothetical protein ACI9NC_005772 [Verrucomicrobiales bacterium]